MGLDLVVEGSAKPGYEDEWRRFLERSFDDEEFSDAEIARFREIVHPWLPAYRRAASWIR